MPKIRCLPSFYIIIDFKHFWQLVGRKESEAGLWEIWVVKLPYLMTILRLNES